MKTVAKDPERLSILMLDGGSPPHVTLAVEERKATSNGNMKHCVRPLRCLSLSEKITATILGKQDTHEKS
jgi:hypothetical protein